MWDKVANWFWANFDVVVALAVLVLLGVAASMAKADLAEGALIAGAVAILVTLLRIRGLLVSLIVSPGPPFSRFDVDDLSKRLASAQTLYIVGVHQETFLVAFPKLGAELAPKLSKIRVLLVDPGGYAATMAGMRFAEQHASEAGKIKESLELLKDTSAEVKTIDYLLPYGAFYFDKGKSSEYLMIERYTFRTHGGLKKPVSGIPRDSGWFQVYEEELERLWEAGTPYGN